MKEKVISIDNFGVSKKKQRDMLQKLEKLVVSQILNEQDLKVSEKVLLQTFRNSIKLMMDYENFSLRQVQLFLDRVFEIPKKEFGSDEAYYVGVYTCMVTSSLGKLLNFKVEEIWMFVMALIDSHVSVTAFSKYLNVFLSEEVMQVIREKQDSKFLLPILVDLIQDSSFWGREVEKMIPSFCKRLRERLDQYSKQEKEKIVKGWLEEEKLSFSEIYRKIKEQMEYLNMYASYTVYTEEQFWNLKKIKKFIYLPKEDQELFLKTVWILDKKVDGALDKIERILILIDSFGFNLKETNVVQVDFLSKKR